MEKRAVRRELWRSRVEEFASSGESAVEFCRRRGLNRPSLYRWRRIFAIEEAGSAKAGPSSRFLPVRVINTERSHEGSAGVELVLGSGRVLRLGRGFDPAALQAAVVALEQLSC